MGWSTVADTGSGQPVRADLCFVATRICRPMRGQSLAGPAHNLIGFRGPPLLHLQADPVTNLLRRRQDIRRAGYLSFASALLGCLPRHAQPLSHWRYQFLFSGRHQFDETRSAVAQRTLDTRAPQQSGCRLFYRYSSRTRCSGQFENLTAPYFAIYNIDSQAGLYFPSE